MGRRYAAVLRTVVIVCASALALVLSGSGSIPLIGAIAAVNLWNVGYVINLLRGFRVWAFSVDLGVCVIACLSQRWTVAPAHLWNGTGWVLVVVSIVIVANHWYTGIGVGLATTALLTSAYILGVVLAEPGGWASALTNVWLVSEGALSRGLWVLVGRGARAADRQIGLREQARRAATVAAARRADEREYLCALHDTAAATLLMVGTGFAGGSRTWLADQAARDVAILRGEQDRDAEAAMDLVSSLANVAARSRLEVRLSAPAELMLPWGAGMALCGAVTEALTNAARHSGRTEVSLVASETDGRVRVEVADTGHGFTLGEVRPSRRGLSSSIVERMNRAGGTATVTSEPGHGTRVRMEWPRG